MEEWQKDIVRVRVQLPSDPEEITWIPVGINGTMYDVPRGVDVEIPRAIADIIETRSRDVWVIKPDTQAGPLQGLKYVGTVPTYPMYYVSEGNARGRAVRVPPRGPLAGDVQARVARERLAETIALRAGSGSRVGVPGVGGDAPAGMPASTEGASATFVEG